MKLRFNYFLLVAFFITNNLTSQITGEFFGKKAEFKVLAKRTLIVETLLENPEVISKLYKKENHNKLIENYKRFIRKYNEYIQICVYKYWKFNTIIEFKNETEVGHLKRAKDNKYALLRCVELNDSTKGHFEEFGYTIPAIEYTRMEIPEETPDYRIYIPSTFIRVDRNYIEADFRAAITIMQDNIKYVMKMNESVEFQDFILDISDKHCSKLKRFTVMVEKCMLPKELTESRVREICETKIEWVDVQDIETHMFNKTKNKAALFAIPFTILKNGKSNASKSSVVFFKIVVDCETGNILWTNDGDLGKISIDKNPSQFMTERDFKHLAPCKS